jgi:hypothetical protein
MVAAVFNHIFASALRDHGYEDGMETDSIADAWNSRLQEGRAKAWRTVDDPPKDAGERRYRQGLLRKLNTIADELATEEAAEDDDNDGNGESEENNEPANQGNEGNEGDADDEAGSEDSQAAVVTDAGSQESDAAEFSSGQRTTDPPLEIIHSFVKEAQRPDIVTRASSKDFINHDNPVYQLGGRVYRAIIDGKNQDVMICNKKQCRRCRKLKTNDEIQAQEVSKTKCLPFVHAIDFRVVTRVGFEFNREIAAYSENYPKDMWKTRVTFSDGVKREVMVCVAANCAHCSGKEAVEKRNARYLPGGRLYPLVEAAERTRER